MRKFMVGTVALLMGSLFQLGGCDSTLLQEEAANSARTFIINIVNAGLQELLGP